MSCETKGTIGKITSISQPAIVKGSDAFIVTQTITSPDKCPSKIQGFLGATGFFANDDGTVQYVPGELESEDLGKIRFDIPASGTSLLKASDEASFEYSLEDDNGLIFIQFDGKLQIKDRLF